MKIAVFHNLLSGGAKRALYGFCKVLTKMGYEIYAYVPDTADENFLPLEEVVDKIHIFPVRHNQRAVNSYLSLPINYNSNPLYLTYLEECQKEIASVINQSNADIVFIEQDSHTMSPFILKYINKPMVYYCQQPVLWEKTLSQEQLIMRILRWIWFKLSGTTRPGIDRLNASYAKYILTNSQFSKKNILESYGISPSVCYLGVDTEIFKFFNKPKEDFVLSAGVCCYAKGFDFLIRSLGLIKKSLRLPLIIASNRTNKLWELYLKALAFANGVQLEIKHLIDDNYLVELYNKAKLVLYASRYEPFGFVPVEAMACGTPVIAVKEGGLCETVVNNESGILTKRNESEFAEAITTLLKDKKRCNMMGQRGIELVQRYWNLDLAGERLVIHLENAMTHETNC